MGQNILIFPPINPQIDLVLARINSHHPSRDKQKFRPPPIRARRLRFANLIAAKKYADPRRFLLTKLSRSWNRLRGGGARSITLLNHATSARIFFTPLSNVYLR
jgi:hypothetical protein